MNKIILTKCNLAKDPDLRFTSNQKPVCSFTIADNHYYKGENQASFFNVVTWNKTAENCGKYLKKGSAVNVYGRLQQRSYEANDGKRYIIEIIADTVEFLGGKKEQQSPQDPPAPDDPDTANFPDFGVDENGEDIDFPPV